MNRFAKLSAATLATAVLSLSPGVAAADITEFDDGRAENRSMYLRHWGLDPQDVRGPIQTQPDGYVTDGSTGSGTGPRVDTGAARNDVGPMAPAEPDSTPASTGFDPDDVIGWTAAGVGAAAALLAGGIFLRRRFGPGRDLPHPV